MYQCKAYAMHAHPLGNGLKYKSYYYSIILKKKNLAIRLHSGSSIDRVAK